jgi:cation diffusion facilitator CzcD-associated flavoprotein CzcO
MTKPIKKIAIIGAGPTGLAQLKNLLEVSKSPKAKYELQVKVFESKPDVGGVWYVSQLKGCADNRYSTGAEKHYRKAVNRDVKGKGKEKMYIYPPGDEEPSPMYEGLRTNLPHVRHDFSGCIWEEDMADV